MMDLKSRFELSRELPNNQERLSWELPRFLDAASRRGKIIVVIDGLHRVANNDDSEANLAWLPLVLPPGVRFVISASDIAPSRKPRPVAVPMPVPTGAPAVPSPKTDRPGNSFADTARSSSPATGEPGQAAIPKVNSKVDLMLDGQLTSRRATAVAGMAGTGASGLPGYHQVGDDDSDLDSEELRALRNIRGRRIMAELERRQLTGLDMKPMDRPTCRAMIEAYVRKSVQTAVAAAHAARGDSSDNFPAMAMAMGTFLTGMHGAGATDAAMEDDMNAEMDSFLSGFMDSPQGGTDANGSPTYGAGSASGSHGAVDFVPGFLLFESQINALLNHSQGSTPLFLRLILRCAHNAVARGFSLWYIWDDWLKATSVSELLERILLSLEKGHAPSPQSMAGDEARTVREGGLAALVRLYPWHPSLRRVHKRAQEVAERQRKQDAKDAQDTENRSRGHGFGRNYGVFNPGGSLSMSVGSTVSDDTAQLEQLIAQSQPALTADDEELLTPSMTGLNSVNGSMLASVPEGSSTPTSRLPSINLGGGPVLRLATPQPLTPPSGMHGLTASVHTLSSGGTMAAHMGMGITKGAGTSILQSLGDQQWLSASQNAENRLDEALRTAEKGVDKAMLAAKRAASSAQASGAVPWRTTDASGRSGLGLGGGAGPAYIDVMMNTVVANANAYASVSSPGGRAGHSHSPTALLQSLQAESDSVKTYPSSASTHSVKTAHTVHTAREPAPIDVEALLIEAQLKEAQDNYTEPEDPHEVARVGLGSLPVCLRGGLMSQGLGALLGNALSLLFVARHGLKEAELWAMLATLRARPPEYIEMLQRQRVQQEKSRAVLQVGRHVQSCPCGSVCELTGCVFGCVVCSLLSAICRALSAVCCLLTVVCCLLYVCRCATPPAETWKTTGEWRTTCARAC